MNRKLDILGSYIATCNYTLDEDGLLTSKDTFYPINAFHSLTIIKDLPVTIDGAETTLNPGTSIFVTGTNNVDEIHFKVIDSDQTGPSASTRTTRSSVVPPVSAPGLLSIRKSTKNPVSSSATSVTVQWAAVL